MATPEPSEVRVRMYDVGFGDCLLVSFTYPDALDDGRRERHMLIDFGRNAASVEKWTTEQIAADIAGRCRADPGGVEGGLDVVVVTHRHRDHLSAFGTASVAKTLSALDPKLVVRSWTEDPKVTDAQGLAASPYLAAIESGQRFAERLNALIPPGQRRGLAGDVAGFAADQLANPSAVQTLEDWSKPDRGEYLSFGKPTRIGTVIPGIGVSVIGPPTDKDWKNISTQATESDEYWTAIMDNLEIALSADAAGAMLDAAGAEVAADAEGAEAAAARIAPPGPARWLIEKLGRQQLASVQRIVHRLDDVLNNTSVILLIKAGRRRLLFPGDAQLENWQYALGLDGAPAHPDIVDELRLVDLYKVGHHGSRNATPRTALYGLWAPEGKTARSVASIVSTKTGYYDRTKEGAVPNVRLLAALESGRMRLYSTEATDFDGRLFIELRASTSGSTGFRLQPT